MTRTNVMNQKFKKYFTCFLFLCLSVSIFLLYFEISIYHMYSFLQGKIPNIFKHKNDFYEIKNYDNMLQKLKTEEVNESSIFFIESRSHVNEMKDILFKRQACSVESAAIAHPKRTIYVLYPSLVKFNLSTADTYVQALLQYPNVKLRHIPMGEYMQNTPLANWYKKGVLKTSYWPVEHTSDVLRLVTLWKFGGIYLDLDTITFRSLDSFIPFAALESLYYVASGALGASLTGISHDLMTKALMRIDQHFNGLAWSVNGPLLITSLLKDLCNITKNEVAANMNKERCKGFNVFPSKYFYPVGFYSEWKYFTNGSEADLALSNMKDSYATHLWNKVNSNRPVIIEYQPLYARLAKKFCPQVYKNCGNLL